MIIGAPATIRGCLWLLASMIWWKICLTIKRACGRDTTSKT